MRKQKNIEPPTPTTIIGQGLKLESANLTGAENVVINGVYLGDVDLDGTLSVGATGKVIGNLRAKRIEVAGQVRGVLHCDATIYLASTAYVEGSIETQVLKMDEGARINGKCQMANGMTEDISLELSDIEGKPRYDFSSMGDAFIPDDGSPIIARIG
jgi:cytoskeletal protein CcmA (bactofilin family)